MILISVLFIFKQKTAYEMRISDWSSDVCSSDLPGLRSDFIKRVIGLPGDTVAVEGGRVWLNGRPLQRSEMPLMVWPVSPNLPCDGPRYDPYLVVAPDGCRACAVPRYREHLPHCVRSPRSEERRVGNGCVRTCRARV